MDKVKLEVLGLSYSQTQAGAYALILSVENSEQRIPIIIGGFEAQSIAIHLEKLKPPRPLTHDLFHTLANTYKLKLREVFIYKLEEGVFYAKLYFEENGQTSVIDSRTSDAVALALRFNCPIYTTENIVEKAGIVLNVTEESEREQNLSKDSKSELRDFLKYSIAELEALMQEAINNEDYEKASIIRDEINKRSNE
ncbi:MAG: bifunctional nuclease family protein [Bacteroidales bacterium]|nr:bifunctional nuclease family protein [Bacteroidales bacterium]